MGNSRRVHLRQLAIRNQCTVDWNGMRGDAAVRFCGSCKSNVYNLSEMSEQDVEQLLARGDDVCVRYYYRPDGTIVTSACPPTVRRSPTVAAASVAGALVYTTAFVGISAAVEDTSASGVATRSDGLKVAMGGALRIAPREPRDPAEVERRHRDRRERRRAREQLRHQAINDAAPGLLPPEEAQPAVELTMPAQAPPAAAPVWPVAVLLGLGALLAVLLTSWLAFGIATAGAMSSLAWHRAGRPRDRDGCSPLSSCYACSAESSRR